MREIQEHKIKIYEFPETDDEEENRLVKKIKVCGSTSHTYVAVCVLKAPGFEGTLVLLPGQAAAGCGRKQHHHRGERQEGARQAVPLGGRRRYTCSTKMLIKLVESTYLNKKSLGKERPPFLKCVGTC